MSTRTNSKNDIHSEPLFYQDATELARLIRTKEVSSVEVVQAHLDRIEKVNPKVNAVVTLIADDALNAAKIAEQAVLRGDELGAFHGVPFSIKDSIDTAGILTQSGSKVLAGNIPETDATTVARMKRAGAIPLVKTNVPEFSGWWETDNLVTGRTNNPWDLERTPGGSSGGESAAIAAGISPIGLGSDVAISVRGPAALTGIVGLKATHGRIPYTGHLPRYLSRFWHIGPMARSVRDITTALEVLKGADGIDPYAVHARTVDGSNAPLGGRPIRIGWMADQGFGVVDTEIVKAVQDAASHFDSLGHSVEQTRIPILEENNFVDHAMTLFMGEMLPDFRKIIVGHEKDLHAVSTIYANWTDPSLAEYVHAEAKVQQLRSAFAAYFENFDVLLIPVLPMTAQLHGQQEYEVNGQKVPPAHIMRATVPFNLTGLPGLSVPVGFSSKGLPINVQLVARWFDEATILRLGALLEAANESKHRRPDL